VTTPLELRLTTALQDLRQEGLYKPERVLQSAQGGRIRTQDHEVINLCANNYLGLANHPALREAAQQALERFGYGMASVRFICGAHRPCTSNLNSVWPNFLAWKMRFFFRPASTRTADYSRRYSKNKMRSFRMRSITRA
jgi:hypothetical protein